MDVDNENQDNQLPDRCTYDQVLWHVDKYSSLPPPVVLRTAPAEELGKIVDCVKLAPFLKDFFPAAFGAFVLSHHFIPALPPSRPSISTSSCTDDLLNSSPRLLWYADGMDEATAAPDKAARLEAATLSLVRQLDSGTMPDSAAKKATEWVLPELSRTLGTRGLLAVLEAILAGLGGALSLPNAPRSYAFLPTILSHLGMVDHHEGLSTRAGEPLKDGAAVMAYALSAIEQTEWPATSLVPLATMLRDLTLSSAARRALVARFTARFAELDPTQMPALVYQVMELNQGYPGVQLISGDE